MQKLGSLWRDEAGATAVEYSLMVAAIAAAIIATVFAVGTKVQGQFQSYENSIP